MLAVWLSHAPIFQVHEAEVGAAVAQWVAVGVGSIGPGAVVALGTVAEVQDPPGVSEVCAPQSVLVVVEGALAVMAAVAA